MAVILWAGTFEFHRKATEDSINDCRDIGFSKQCIVNFLYIAFIIWIVTRISCKLTVYKGWIGTWLVLFRFLVVLVVENVSSWEQLMALLSHYLSSLQWLWLFFLHCSCTNQVVTDMDWVVTDIVEWTIMLFLVRFFICGIFLASSPTQQQISLLFSWAEFTSLIPNWKYTLSAVHALTFVNACKCIGLMPCHNSFNRSYINLVYICCVNLI